MFFCRAQVGGVSIHQTVVLILTDCMIMRFSPRDNRASLVFHTSFSTHGPREPPCGGFPTQGPRDPPCGGFK